MTKIKRRWLIFIIDKITIGISIIIIIIMISIVMRDEVWSEESMNVGFLEEREIWGTFG